MKVYVVTEEQAYEVSEQLGVFATREAAQSFYRDRWAKRHPQRAGEAGEAVAFERTGGTFDPVQWVAQPEQHGGFLCVYEFDLADAETPTLLQDALLFANVIDDWGDTYGLPASAGSEELDDALERVLLLGDKDSRALAFIQSRNAQRRSDG